MLERAGIKVDDDLLPPPCPPELQYLLAWYIQLSRTRLPSMSGVSPIQYSEITHWAKWYGNTLTRFELNCLLDLDDTFRVVALKVQQEKTPKGPGP